MEGQDDVSSTTLNIAHILGPKLKSNLDAKADVTLGQKEKVAKYKKKHQKDDFICQGHILLVWSDHLYDLHKPITYPIEIWKALGTNCNVEEKRYS